MQPLSSNTPPSLIPHEAQEPLENRLLGDEGGDFRVIPFELFIETVCSRYLSILRAFKFTSKLLQEISDHLLPRELFTFGTRDWQWHFAQRREDNTIQYAEMDEEPVLPKALFHKLHEPCPKPLFEQEIFKVYQRCMLVLIPKKINHNNYCLNALNHLIQHPLKPKRALELITGNHFKPTMLGTPYETSPIAASYGVRAPQRSYYVLISTISVYNISPEWGCGTILEIITSLAAYFVKKRQILFVNYHIPAEEIDPTTKLRLGVGCFPVNTRYILSLYSPPSKQSTAPLLRFS